MRTATMPQYGQDVTAFARKRCSLCDNLHIREATERDLFNLIPLFGQLGMDEGQMLPAEDAERIFRRIMAYPDYRIYLADFEGIVVGVFALLIMDNLGHLGTHSAVVEDVIVSKDWRGRGIGRKMMTFAMDAARDKGCYKLVLSSNRHRVEAHRFYEALGFEQHGLSFLIEVKADETLRR